MNHAPTGICALLLLLWAPVCPAPTNASPLPSKPLVKEHPENTGKSERAEGPRVDGPVPPFLHHVLVKRLVQRVYFDVSYPEFGISFVDEDIRKGLAGLVELEEFKDFAAKEDEDDRIIAKERFVSYELSAPQPDILSVALFAWLFDRGMTHGYRPRFTRTYDLSAQKILRLEDVLPNRETALRELLEQQLEECASFVDLETFSGDFSSFYLDSDSLALVFGGLPPPAWGACEEMYLEKAELQKAGADMRLWKPKRPHAGDDKNTPRRIRRISP